MSHYLSAIAVGAIKEIKTPLTHPYSYDPFVIFETEGNVNSTIYSDRLLQWDFDKHDELCQKHFGNKGQSWDKRDPNKIEQFLRDWCKDDCLKLVRITQHCNVSNGFPCWQFDFATNSQ